VADRGDQDRQDGVAANTARGGKPRKKWSAWAQLLRTGSVAHQSVWRGPLLGEKAAGQVEGRAFYALCLHPCLLPELRAALSPLPTE